MVKMVTAVLDDKSVRLIAEPAYQYGPVFRPL